jgi:uncharacterized protein YggE
MAMLRRDPALISRVIGAVLPIQLGLAGVGLASPPWAWAQSGLRCDGALLEVRGQAEQRRPIQLLRIALALEAEATSADAALAELQRRLALVRSSLRELEVQELRVSSPATWPRPAEPKRPAAAQASVQINGQLAPEHLQALIRRVGALPGVRLEPVSAEADPTINRQVRQRLLRAAYQDAVAQARDISVAIDHGEVRPLEVLLDGRVGSVPMRAALSADAAVPPFDSAELPQPLDRLSLLVRFCAHR